MDRSRTTDQPLFERAAVQTREIQRILTPEEDAVVNHLRNNCHNEAICFLCSTADRLREIDENLMQYKEMYEQSREVAKALQQAYRDHIEEVIKQRDEAQRRLDSPDWRDALNPTEKFFGSPEQGYLGALERIEAALTDENDCSTFWITVSGGSDPVTVSATLDKIRRMFSTLEEY